MPGGEPCDVPDCLICEAVAGRCPGECVACDTFDRVFPFWAGRGGRCVDCLCPGCAARRRRVRGEAGRPRDGAA